MTGVFCRVGCIVLGAFMAFAIYCASAAGQDNAREGKKTVVVFAAASTTNAIDKIKERFAKQSGIEVQTSYASSAQLAQQIVHGADADIFISADVKWADTLADKKLVAQRRDALGNRLVIVAPTDSKSNLAKPDDLLLPAVEHIAIGEPASVPAGKYAKQALEKLELWSKLKEKIVPAQDVRQALTYVETGAAEAGIVYATDAAISKKVKVVASIPEKLTEPIRYPFALLRQGNEKPEARSFYEYLGSAEADQVFKQYGFTILAKGGNPDK